MPDLFHGLVEEGNDGVGLEGVLVERDVEQLQEQVRVAVVLRQRRLQRRPRARTVPQLQAHEAGVPVDTVVEFRANHFCKGWYYWDPLSMLHSLNLSVT